MEFDFKNDFSIQPLEFSIAVMANHLLAAVPFANSDRTEPLAVIYRKNRKLTPAMTSFVQALKQH